MIITKSIILWKGIVYPSTERWYYSFIMIPPSYMVYHTKNQYYNFYLYIGKIIIKLELELSFLYGSTILLECILIVCLIIILKLDLILEERDTSSLYFIFLMGLFISIGLLLFQWNEKPIISFLGNFQTNNFNRIFWLLIALCLLLCIPLSIEYIKHTKMPMTKFIILVLIATIKRMFLCDANYLITILIALECWSLCLYLLSEYTKIDVRFNETIMKFTCGWNKFIYFSLWFFLVIWFIS
jgi:hypothetical protein